MNTADARHSTGRPAPTRKTPILVTLGVLLVALGVVIATQLSGSKGPRAGTVPAYSPPTAPPPPETRAVDTAAALSWKACGGLTAAYRLEFQSIPDRKLAKRALLTGRDRSGATFAEIGEGLEENRSYSVAVTAVDEADLPISICEVQRKDLVWDRRNDPPSAIGAPRVAEGNAAREVALKWDAPRDPDPESEGVGGYLVRVYPGDRKTRCTLAGEIQPIATHETKEPSFVLSRPRDTCGSPVCAQVAALDERDRSIPGEWSAPVEVFGERVGCAGPTTPQPGAVEGATAEAPPAQPPSGGETGCGDGGCKDGEQCVDGACQPVGPIVEATADRKAPSGLRLLIIDGQCVLKWNPSVPSKVEDGFWYYRVEVNGCGSKEASSTNVNLRASFGDCPKGEAVEWSVTALDDAGEVIGEKVSARHACTVAP